MKKYTILIFLVLTFLVSINSVFGCDTSHCLVDCGQMMLLDQWGFPSGDFNPAWTACNNAKNQCIQDAYDACAAADSGSSDPGSSDSSDPDSSDPSSDDSLSEAAVRQRDRDLQIIKKDKFEDSKESWLENEVEYFDDVEASQLTEALIACPLGIGDELESRQINDARGDPYYFLSKYHSASSQILRITVKRDGSLICYHAVDKNTGKVPLTETQKTKIIVDAFDDFSKRRDNKELLAKEVPCIELGGQTVLDDILAVKQSSKAGKEITKLSRTDDNEFYYIRMVEGTITCDGYVEATSAEGQQIQQKNDLNEKEYEAIINMAEQIDNSDAYQETIPCENLKGSRVANMVSKVNAGHQIIGDDSRGSAFGDDGSLYSKYIVNGQDRCYKLVHIPYTTIGSTKYRSIVPVPDLTQDQIDFVNAETVEDQRRLKNPTNAERFFDDYMVSTVLYEDDFEWVPGLSVQISSNPQDIVVWGVGVAAGPVVDTFKGTITKRVLSTEAGKKLSTAVTIVSKHNAIYEIAESTSEESTLSGDYKLPFGITVGITYGPELIPEGYTEADLGLFHGTLVAGKIILTKVENFKIDTANRILYGKVECCSIFFVGVEKDPAYTLPPPGVYAFFLGTVAVLWLIARRQKKKGKKATYGTWSLVSGIVGLCLSLFPLLGLAPSVGALYYYRQQKKIKINKKAIAGMMLGRMGIILSVISLMIFIEWESVPVWITSLLIMILVGSIIIPLLNYLLPKNHCSKCKGILPRFRMPKSVKQMLKVLVTCPKCGKEQKMYPPKKK